MLCDVGLDGACDVISRAFLNARYHDRLTKGKDLEPGKRYDFDLEFIDKDHVVAKDHHLELIVSSLEHVGCARREPGHEHALVRRFLSGSSHRLNPPCKVFRNAL